MGLRFHLTGFGMYNSLVVECYPFMHKALGSIPPSNIFLMRFPFEFFFKQGPRESECCWSEDPILSISKYTALYSIQNCVSFVKFRVTSGKTCAESQVCPRPFQPPPPTPRPQRLGQSAFPLGRATFWQEAKTLS